MQLPLSKKLDMAKAYFQICKNKRSVLHWENGGMRFVQLRMHITMFQENYNTNMLFLTSKGKVFLEVEYNNYA